MRATDRQELKKLIDHGGTAYDDLDGRRRKEAPIADVKCKNQRWRQLPRVSVLAAGTLGACSSYPRLGDSRFGLSRTVHVLHAGFANVDAALEVSAVFDTDALA